MHGLRNHFVITDAREQAYGPDTDEIVRICDPQVGVGADQLIVIENAGHKDANVFMRIYNVDGREVEACGNATRCVGWLILEENASDSVVVETLAGPLQCKRAGDLLVSSDMGRVSMDWQSIPLAEERDTLHLDFECGDLANPVALGIGNPHVVFFVDDIDAIDILAVAPAIQADSLFPNSVNVGLAEVKSADRMRLVVYERGAGLTTACGSGACAAVFAAHARGLTAEGRMTVDMPAGPVEIELRNDGSAVMTGPVAFCFQGIL
jgi:diaminopimelate epimerase